VENRKKKNSNFSSEAYCCLRESLLSYHPRTDSCDTRPVLLLLCFALSFLLFLLLFSVHSSISFHLSQTHFCAHETTRIPPHPETTSPLSVIVGGCGVLEENHTAAAHRLLSTSCQRDTDTTKPPTGTTLKDLNGGVELAQRTSLRPHFGFGLPHRGSTATRHDTTPSPSRTLFFGLTKFDSHQHHHLSLNACRSRVLTAATTSRSVTKVPP
jgi:hypothetical protein